MKFAEDNQQEGYVITAYDNGSIAINGKAFRCSLILQSQRLEQDWPLQDISELTDTHVRQLLDFQPELIIIGTGKTLVFPPVASYAELIRQGIGVEFMDTGAACRTYNILSGEGRNVVAGMILPGS